MCGRIFKGLPEGQLDTSFGPPSTKQIADWLQRVLAASNGPLFEELKPGVNVAPTQDLEFLVENKGGAREVLRGRWGLQPAWAKSPEKVMGLWINARSEGAADKPAFRDAMKYGRCVIPVAGFYEWQKLADDDKQPWLIFRADRQPLLLAGLYARHSWGDSCAVLTTSANSMMENIHDRMPVILAPESIDRWLDSSISDPQLVEDLMVSCPNEWLAAYMVSTAVGNSRNQDPSLAEPIERAA